MSRCRWSWPALAGLALVVLAGCGREGPVRYPVAGEVRYQGEPLERGSIQFLTTSGPRRAAAGAVIRAGRYRIPEEHGLEEGKYQVIVESPVPDTSVPAGSMSSPPTKERIAPQYSSADKTQLSAEIKPGGPTQFDFEVQ